MNIFVSLTFDTKYLIELLVENFYMFLERVQFWLKRASGIFDRRKCSWELLIVGAREFQFKLLVDTSSCWSTFPGHGEVNDFLNLRLNSQIKIQGLKKFRKTFRIKGSHAATLSRHLFPFPHKFHSTSRKAIAENSQSFIFPCGASKSFSQRLMQTVVICILSGVKRNPFHSSHNIEGPTFIPTSISVRSLQIESITCWRFVVMKNPPFISSHTSDERHCAIPCIHGLITKRKTSSRVEFNQICLFKCEMLPSTIRKAKGVRRKILFRAPREIDFILFA